MRNAIPSDNSARIAWLDSSVMIVDIRNFTPNLRDTRDSPNGRNLFRQFLSQFYECCLQTCEVACMSDPKEDLYINSTGDGVLTVFLAPDRHLYSAYLAGLVLSNQLYGLCEKYNQRKPKSIPDVFFGIGIDSGPVLRVIAHGFRDAQPPMETYIGNCINVAARLEALTKDYERTSVLFSERFNSLLCKKLFDQDYPQLMNEALTSSSPRRRKLLWKKMTELNEALLVTFMQKHNLRGVSEPMALFRLSPTLGVRQRKAFQRLIGNLCENGQQLRKVNEILDHCGTTLTHASPARARQKNVRQSDALPRDRRR